VPGSRLTQLKRVLGFSRVSPERASIAQARTAGAGQSGPRDYRVLLTSS